MAKVLNTEEVLVLASEAFLGDDYFRDEPEMSNAGTLVTGPAAGREAGVRVGEREGRMTVRVFVPGSSTLSQSFDFPSEEATEETVTQGIQQALSAQAKW